MPWRHQLESEHADRKRNQLWRDRVVIESPQSRLVTVGNQQLLNFCSNDYLGLANHPRLKSAAERAIRDHGTGSGASHLVCGHFDLHHRLEHQLAKFVGAESAIVFSTGYMANLAIPQTFLGRDDLVLEDRLNHASLIDAGRNCDATMRRYPHGDFSAMEKRLADSSALRKMVVTDGVFSMDGDLAPLVKLKQVCDRQAAVFVVDDAHGFGVLGDRGSGSLEESGISPSGNVLMVGTFGKSAGSFGAFVAGDRCYLDALIQHARTYIYTTALPSSVIAATSAALSIFRDEPERRKRLQQNIDLFRNGISGSDLVLMNSRTPIQPILFGTAEAALSASQLLKENGIWVSAIRPPTVPIGSARLRVTLTSEHTTEDIERLTDLLRTQSIACLSGEPR